MYTFVYLFKLDHITVVLWVWVSSHGMSLQLVTIPSLIASSRDAQIFQESCSDSIASSGGENTFTAFENKWRFCSSKLGMLYHSDPDRLSDSWPLSLQCLNLWLRVIVNMHEAKITPLCFSAAAVLRMKTSE